MKSRSGKQCRERYINHLNPDAKKTAWTLEENNILRDMYPEFGTKWSKYMPLLPGRSDNAIKNRYHMISRNSFDCCTNKTGLKRKITEALENGTDGGSNDEDYNRSQIRLNRLVATRGQLDLEIGRLEEQCMLDKQASLSSRSASPSSSDAAAGAVAEEQTVGDILSEFKFHLNGNNQPDPLPLPVVPGHNRVESAETELFLDRLFKRV